MDLKLICCSLLTLKLFVHHNHVNNFLTDDQGDACGLAKSRSRREKREKVGRKSALEQLKKAKKGEKIKYEVIAIVPCHLWIDIYSS